MRQNIIICHTFFFLKLMIILFRSFAQNFFHLQVNLNIKEFCTPRTASPYIILCLCCNDINTLTEYFHTYGYGEERKHKNTLEILKIDFIHASDDQKAHSLLN
jgi:hypothetical protein